MLICNTDFISNEAKNEDGVTNTSNKGGAVYNRIGAETIMVNCVIAGNFSEEEGGGTCNAVFQGSPATETRLDLHNCLLIGNECDTNTTGNLDDGGGHFNRNRGKSAMINCTIYANKAGSQYGGVANRDSGSDLDVLNCIAWGNTDVDGGTSTLDAQVAYETTVGADDVDKGVIEGCTHCFETGGGTEDNTGNDPGFADGVSSLTWTSRSYSGEDGLTSFIGLSGLTVNEHVDKLFQPDNTAVEYLLIVSNTASTITCLGKTATTSGPASIFSPFLCVAPGCAFVHAAEDFGDADYLVDAGDPCDLDNDPFTDVLNRDLYLNVRDQGDAPDAGVHEVDPG